MSCRTFLLLALFILCLDTAAQEQRDPEFVVNEAAFSLPLDWLDPHVVFYLPWDPIYRCLYETPLRCDPNSDVLRLETHLLTSLPTLEDDGTLLRMKFRNDVVFNDDPCFPEGKGRKMTAHDFAFIIKRHIDPRTKSPYYGSYLAGSLLGARRARRKAEKDGIFDYDAEIPGLRVIDDYKVELKFLRPYSRFPALMSMTWLSMIPKEAIRQYGGGVSSHPVGTGPYLYDAGQSTAKKMFFKRNPKYWDAGSGKSLGPLPWNAGVRFNFVKNLDIQEKRFSDGDLSVIDLYPIQLGHLLDKRGLLKRNVMPRGTRLISARDDQLQYIAFNMTNKILGKKKVRQALALALARKRIVHEYYSGNGDLADHLCPPAIPMAAPSKLPWQYGKRDLKRARQFLAEAGYPNGKGLPEFVLETSNATDWEKSLTENIKDSWATIGVRVQIRLQTYPQFLERVRKGLPEISINYWLSDYPDPDNYFMMLTRASAPLKGATADAPNVGFYDNAEYEKLYKKSTKLAQGKERGKIFAKMVRIIQEECPWIYVGHKRQTALVARGVHGIFARSRFSTSYTRVWREIPKKERR